MKSKYQDALNSLNPNYIAKKEYSKEKAKEILQELIDKETPIKVVKWEIAKPITRCPKCGAGVERKDSYCWECGQKIDWSEE